MTKKAQIKFASFRQRILNFLEDAPDSAAKRMLVNICTLPTLAFVLMVATLLLGVVIGLPLSRMLKDALLP